MQVVISFEKNLPGAGCPRGRYHRLVSFPGLRRNSEERILRMSILIVGSRADSLQIRHRVDLSRKPSLPFAKKFAHCRLTRQRHPETGRKGIQVTIELIAARQAEEGAVRLPITAYHQGNQRGFRRFSFLAFRFTGLVRTVSVER